MTGPTSRGASSRRSPSTGASKVPSATITKKIATVESNHAFAGALESFPILSVWDRITVDYEKLDPFVLERDLARVERLYRAEGYYEAHARAARVHKVDGKVRVEIVVDEGEPVKVARVRTAWKKGEEPAARPLAAVQKLERSLHRGAPFVEADFEDVKKGIQRALTDAGYAHATVEGKGDVDLAKHQAVAVYTVDLGPLCKFGSITVEGDPELPRDKLLQAISIKEGDRYSTAKIESAQIALGNLRVAGAVDAIPHARAGGHAEEPRRAARLPRDADAAPDGQDGRRRRARLPGRGPRARRLGEPELPRRAAALHDRGEADRRALPAPAHAAHAAPGESVRPLPGVRLHSELEQPGFIEARTQGVLDLDVSVYRPITSDALIGYFELSGKAGIRREFWNGRISVAASVNMQYDQPFPYTSGTNLQESNGGFRAVTLPYLQASATLDLRRGVDGKLHPIEPHSGVYFSTDTQGAFISSDDVRIRPDFRAYIPVSKRVTLALRVGGGFLVPFGGALTTQAFYPGLCTGSLGDPPSCATYLSQLELLQFRGFFSGGTNDNRGYAYNAVGPQAIVPALSSQSTAPIATGGAAMWAASLELRFPLVGQVGAAWFVDASDVTATIAQMNLKSPHLSTGLGIRYQTPVGPVRVDFGVRVPGLQVIGDTRPVFNPGNAPTQGSDAFLPKAAGQAGSIFGLPMALSLAIGEAF